MKKKGKLGDIEHYLTQDDSESANITPVKLEKDNYEVNLVSDQDDSSGSQVEIGELSIGFGGPGKRLSELKDHPN